MSISQIATILKISQYHVRRLCKDAIAQTIFQEQPKSYKDKVEADIRAKMKIKEETEQAMRVVVEENTLREHAGKTIMERAATMQHAFR